MVTASESARFLSPAKQKYAAYEFRVDKVKYSEAIVVMNTADV